MPARVRYFCRCGMSMIEVQRTLCGNFIPNCETTASSTPFSRQRRRFANSTLIHTTGLRLNSLPRLVVSEFSNFLYFRKELTPLYYGSEHSIHWQPK